MKRILQSQFLKLPVFEKIKLTSLTTIILAPVIFNISFWLLSYYVNGDQVFYHKYYNALYGEKIDRIVYLTQRYLSASEFISGFVLWLGSNLSIDKNVYISFLNVILVIGIFLLARKYHVKIPMVILLLTNFYIVVLMTSAERLKISYIFLVYGVLLSGKKQIILLLLSPFAHIQSAILLFGSFFAYYQEIVKNILSKYFIKYKDLWIVFGIIVFVVIVYIILSSSIKGKINSYGSKDVSIAELINIAVLSSIALYVSSQRFRMSLALFPLFPMILFIGAQRINMIAVTLVIYLLMIENKLHHPLIYLLMLYFSIKSIPFVNNIILYGNGWVV